MSLASSTQPDLLDLRRKLVEEITQLLDPESEEVVNIETIAQIYPNENVRREAAEAAASVIIAFERGWRQGLQVAEDE